MIAWVKLANSAIRRSIAMNQAMFAPFLNGTARETERPPIDSIAFEQGDWAFDRSVDDPAAITIGDTVSFSKDLDEADVGAFARATGDTNRLHLDGAFADGTRFDGRIVHGTLVAGIISATLARLPGLTIYLSQELEFQHPVRLGDRVSGTVEVVEALDGNQYRLATTVVRADREQPVVDGEALVLVDEPLSTDR